MKNSESKSITSEIRPALFLDTNALRHMFSYLRYAKILNLPPYEEKNWAEVKKALHSKLPEGFVNDIMKGAKTLAYLQRQTKDHETAVYTSRFAKSEILCSSLEGLAHARFAQEGIIYRMRQRRRTLSELVSMYLEASDSDVVVNEWNEMLSLLEDEGEIDVELVEDNTNFKQIAAIAEFLQSKVFIDVLDSWMYGCALAVQAEQIVTFDIYFRTLVNKLNNPSGEINWSNLKNEMLAYLQGLFGGTDTTIEISLPRVEDLPNDVPRVWR